MFFQRKLFRWCIFILSGLVLPAMAADMVVERAWLEDASGQKTYAQVQAQTLTPYEGVLSRGFGTSAIWVKLRIARPQSQVLEPGQKDDLVLRIRPVYLDDVQVYDQGK